MEHYEHNEKMCADSSHIGLETQIFRIFSKKALITCPLSMMHHSLHMYEKYILDYSCILECSFRTPAYRTYFLADSFTIMIGLKMNKSI
jgi:hypothetical protein